MSLAAQITALATRIGAEIKLLMRKSSNLSDLANRQTAINNLTAASGATTNHVLTRDASGNVVFQIWHTGPAARPEQDRTAQRNTPGTMGRSPTSAPGEWSVSAAVAEKKFPPSPAANSIALWSPGEVWRGPHTMRWLRVES